MQPTSLHAVGAAAREHPERYRLHRLLDGALPPRRRRRARRHDKVRLRRARGDRGQGAAGLLARRHGRKWSKPVPESRDLLRDRGRDGFSSTSRCHRRRADFLNPTPDPASGTARRGALTSRDPSSFLLDDETPSTHTHQAQKCDQSPAFPRAPATRPAAPAARRTAEPLPARPSRNLPVGARAQTNQRVLPRCAGARARPPLRSSTS